MMIFVMNFPVLDSNYASAQDVIVKKDGSTVLTKVLEISTTDIKYKKFSNQNGPTYTIEKSSVMSINYENGDKDLFNDVPAGNVEVQQTNSNTNKLVKKAASANNQSIIALYNQKHTVTKKIDLSDKKPYQGFFLYWVSPSSIMANDDLDMKILRTEGEGSQTNPNIKYEYYVIQLKNKTDRFIYVDLAHCFRNCSTGESYCYYNAEQTTVTQGGGSGVSVGLGGVIGAAGSGIAVGGGTNSSVSKSYGSQRVISIPPHGQRNLTDEKWVEVKSEGLFTTGKYTKVEKAESFVFDTGLKRDEMKCQLVEYEESNSPFTVNYLITYSDSETFDKYSTLTCNLFLQSYVGQRYLGYPDKPERYLENMNDYTLYGSFIIGSNDKMRDKVREKRNR